MNNHQTHARIHCVKSVCIPSYSGPQFPAFGLNKERYSVSLRIQSECGKMLTRITPNRNTFYRNIKDFFLFIKLYCFQKIYQNIHQILDLASKQKSKKSKVACPRKSPELLNFPLHNLLQKRKN